MRRWVGGRKEEEEGRAWWLCKEWVDGISR